MQWHLLEHAFDTILEAGEIPPPPFFTEILCQAAVQHDYDKVAAMVNAMIHAPFQVSEQQWTEVLEAYRNRITGPSLQQLSEAVRGHDLVREATIGNLSRALQSLHSSSCLATSSGNEAPSKMISPGDGSSSNIHRDPPGNIGDLDLLEDISSTTTTFWKRNSGFLEDEEDADTDDDDDDAGMKLDISAIGFGNGDDSDEHNVPSANEILKSWKDSINNESLSFQFPLSRN